MQGQRPGFESGEQSLRAEREKKQIFTPIRASLRDTRKLVVILFKCQY
jgi:hypothetical protein